MWEWYKGLDPPRLPGSHKSGNRTSVSCSVFWGLLHLSTMTLGSFSKPADHRAEGYGLSLRSQP